MSAGVAAALLRVGAARAERRAEVLARAGAAEAAEALPSVRAEADGAAIRLAGGGIRRRLSAGCIRIIDWIERVRALAGGTA